MLLLLALAVLIGGGILIMAIYRGLAWLSRPRPCQES